MFIQTEETPNPATLKFLPGQVLLENASRDYTDLDVAAKESPLAERLLTLDGVDRVFISCDFVSVTKSDDLSWDQMRMSVMAALSDHFTQGQPIIMEGALKDTPDAKAHAEEDSEIVAQIKELLETRVRPAVAMDGGDIVFHEFDKGIVYLKMQGACAGCPSSTATLKMGIENMLRHFIPEVLEVRPVDPYLT